MRPVLFHIFSYPIGAYGFFMTAAHLCGVAALVAITRRRNLPLGPFLDMIFAVILFGVIGARLGYAFNQWDEFKSDPWSLLWISKSGLSFYGGFGPAFFAFVGVLYWRKVPVLETADIVCPVLPFSLGLIRLGCFAQGCCYGAPTTVPWAVTFTLLESKVPPALLNRSLHPSQLYESAFLLFLAAVLALAPKKSRFPPGTVATFSIFAYAVYRLSADSMRGDLTRGFWGISWMSPTQGAALLGILAAPVVLWICYKMRKLPA